MAGVELETIAPPNSALADEPGRPRQRAVSVEDSGMGDLLRFDAERLRILVERHLLFTGSARARELLDDWDSALARFVKVMPRDYRRAARPAGRSATSDTVAAESLLKNAWPSHAPSRHRTAEAVTKVWRRCMGKVTGFLEIERHDRGYEKPEVRLQDVHGVPQAAAGRGAAGQAARCMDCGIPFCHNGCPVNNHDPRLEQPRLPRPVASRRRSTLHSTNNFPEFTGRVCPAPCEASCTLNIDDNPVTIKTIECAIVDRGWEEGWIVPHAAVAHDRQARSRWSARGRPAWPARSSLRAPATR